MTPHLSPDGHWTIRDGKGQVIRTSDVLPLTFPTKEAAQAYIDGMERD